MSRARTPPHSEEAERAVLGSLLIDSERVHDHCIRLGISDKSFFVHAHRIIWAQACAMLAKGQHVDVWAVTLALRDAGKLDEVGGSAYLDRLIDETPTAAHSESYAAMVVDRETRRMLIDASRIAIESAHDMDEPAEVVRSKSEYAIAQLQRHAGKRRTLADALNAQLERYEQARTRGCAGEETGFRCIDDVFSGLVPGGVLIVSGTAGSCKTTLVRNILENLAIRGVASTLCTIEQTDEQIAGAIAARHARVSVFDLLRGKGDLDAVRASAPVVAAYPITIDDSPQTLTSLWSTARRIASKGCTVLALDYIQRITPEKDYHKESERIRHYSEVLTQMAKQLRVCVLAVSALSREGNLYGSAGLDYDCMGHLSMRPSEEEEGEYIVSYHKNRYGPCPHEEQRLYLWPDQNRMDETRPIRHASPLAHS